MNEEWNNEHGSDQPSRKAQKKRVQEYRTIAEKIIQFNHSQLSAIEISSSLFEAIITAQKLKFGNALRRQLSYISKLIQKDNNHDAIKKALRETERHDINYQKLSTAAEKWRDQFILHQDKNTISQFIQQHPQTNRQQLNQHIRNAQQEHKKNTDEKKNNKYYKQLFNFIRSTITETN